MSGYFSQDALTCGDHVEVACGPVSLTNSMVFLQGGERRVNPKSIINMADATSLHRCGGMSPDKLRGVCVNVCKSLGMSVRVVLHHPCDSTNLMPGSLMYVGGVNLKNAQGGVQYELPTIDSHIVMLESVGLTGLVVINPDCRKRGNGFEHGVWGRMIIPHSHLDEVWQTTRPDKSRTLKAAVVIVAEGQRYGCKALVLLANNNDENQRAIASSGGVARVVSTMENERIRE